MDSFFDIVALAGSVLSVVLLLLLMKRFRSESSGDSERILRDELRAGRGESQEAARELREELGRGLKDGNDSLTKSLAETSKVQSAQLEGFAKKLEDLSESNRRAIDRVRENLEQRVKELREGNEKKLEEMRAKGRPDKEIADWDLLVTEICQAINSKQLIPTMRSQYMRTAFQVN